MRSFDKSAPRPAGSWRLGLALFILAMPGVVASAWLALPLLVAPELTPVPLETLQIATALQGGLLLLPAIALGTILGPRLGFAAPVLTAWIGGECASVKEALRPRFLPALIGGLVGALIIIAFHALSPQMLAAAQDRRSIPVVVRILYGGITEEVLIRWGLMTLLAWGGWRAFQGGKGTPSGTAVWAAIAASALLFGIAHVPSAASVMTAVPISVVAYIVVGNALFGLVAGYLFWRHGLEAAMAAHVLAHVVAFVVRG